LSPDCSCYSQKFVHRMWVATGWISFLMSHRDAHNAYHL